MGVYSGWSDEDLGREVNRRTDEIEGASRAWEDRDSEWRRWRDGSSHLRFPFAIWSACQRTGLCG